ncbi:hypothetical protein BDZ89DRAFT_1078588 [Hymenopellis radicata]|nr:hypothetical protein BDZ89DRAFT_1078588 [Hymenopellis radicata]
MSSELSQELFDLIVDNVRSILGWSAAQAPLLSLLQAARCFGPRCRKYIYEKISLSVGVDSGILDESMKKRNLRLLEIIQDPSNDIGQLVKRVTYDLRLDSDEVVRILETTAWDTLTRLKHLLVNVEDVEVNFIGYERLHGFYTSSAIHFDTPLAQALARVLPTSAFTKLEITSVKLHPVVLVEMLSKYPHVSALNLSNITYDFLTSDPWPDPRLAACPPSNITDLGINDTELLEAEMGGLQNFFSGVRRLMLLCVTLNDEIMDTWYDLQNFLSTMKQLDELSLQLDSLADGPYLPEMLRASSVWLELRQPTHLAHLSDSLVAEVDFPINLRRLTVIGYDWDATEWRVLAHALCNPRLSTLVAVTIVIEYASRTVDEEHIEETREYFNECPAKVTVECMAAKDAWHLYRPHTLY